MSDLGDVVRDLAPRLPRAGWEGWFLIAIFRQGSAVRWSKTHLFRSRRRPLHTPLSALEGLRAPGELVSYVATGEEVIESRSDFFGGSGGDLLVGARKFELRVPGELEWGGPLPEYRFSRDDPRRGLSLAFEARARDRVQWIRLPPLLSYFGLHSKLSGRVGLGDKIHEVRGLGILEHAWGALVPFNPVRLIRGPWHWDVLSFEAEAGEEAHPPAALAALSVPVPGRGARGVRARGRLPGGAFQGFRGFRAEYLEFARSEGPGGGESLNMPRRWLGRLEDRAGKLCYEAQASTPVAHAAPGGGFLGFDFEARYRPRGKGAERVFSGSGFTECGSPTWRG